MKAKLQYLDQEGNSYHASKALLINVAVRHHNITKMYEMVGLKRTAVEDSRADQVFLEAGYKIRVEPGDLVLARYTELTHFVKPIAKGFRYSNVPFTKEPILGPHERDEMRPVPGCDRAFGGDYDRSDLRAHMSGSGEKRRKGGPVHTMTSKEIDDLLAERDRELAGAAEEQGCG